MSFPVAVQSAIFYFLACTPCMAARGRHRTRKQAKREREERGRRDAQEPNIYRHPSPFNVNPYWAEEIAMGPSLPKKGKVGSKNMSQRKLNSAGKDGSVATRSSLAVSNGTGAATTNPQGSPTLVPEDARSMSMSMSMERSVTESSIDGWNYKRYQREDEELWGHEQSRTHKLMDAIVKAGSSAGRLLESRLGKEKEKQVTDEDRARFYSVPIHPPVNEYHPPVVTAKPTNKDALKWMLQPPPPAKVMEGKVPVSRSASMASSYARRVTPGSDASLGRAMSERVLEAKLRRGEVPAEGEKLPLGGPGSPSVRKAKAPSRARSQRSARSNSLSAESEGSSEGAPKRRRRRTQRAVATPERGSDDEGEDYFEAKLPAGEHTHAAQRPKLETILSSDASSRAEVGGGGQEERKENISLSEQLEGTSRRERETVSDPSPVKERATGPSIDSGLALST